MSGDIPRHHAGFCGESGTLTGGGEWTRSDQKHPVRLWLWSRPRWFRRKQWCSSDGYATGNQAERLLEAASTYGPAHIEFYPENHAPQSDGPTP